MIQHSADNGDFPYGDWTAPYRTPAGRDELFAANGGHFDLLLGRRTYDMWSGFWPKAPSSPMADGLNAATKYVARALHAVLNLHIRIQRHAAFGFLAFAASDCAACV